MITEEHKAQLDKILSKCVDHPELLTEWERDFMSEFIDKLEKYGVDIRISDKQQGIFDRVEKKLTDGGVL